MIPESYSIHAPTRMSAGAELLIAPGFDVPLFVAAAAFGAGRLYVNGMRAQNVTLQMSGWVAGGCCVGSDAVVDRRLLACTGVSAAAHRWIAERHVHLKQTCASQQLQPCSSPQPVLSILTSCSCRTGDTVLTGSYGTVNVTSTGTGGIYIAGGQLQHAGRTCWPIGTCSLSSLLGCTCTIAHQYQHASRCRADRTPP